MSTAHSDMKVQAFHEQRAATRHPHFANASPSEEEVEEVFSDPPELEQHTPRFGGQRPFAFPPHMAHQESSLNDLLAAMALAQKMQNDKNLSNLPGRSALEQKARLLALSPLELLEEPVSNFVALPMLWTRFVDAAPHGVAERYERLLLAIETKVLPRSHPGRLETKSV